MRYLIFLFIPFLIGAAPLDMHVAYDKDTGQIVYRNYGTQGFQKCNLGQNCEDVCKWKNVICVPNVPMEYQDVPEFALEYKNGKVQKKMTDAEIKAIKNSFKEKDIKMRIVEAEIKKDKSDALGYTDVSEEYQKEIDEMQTKITSLTNE